MPGLVTFIKNLSCTPKMTEIAVLSETKTSGINGGSITGRIWNSRILNSISSNQSNGWCSLNASTGQFVLKAGKYMINGNAVGVGVGAQKLRIRNITDNLSYNGLSSLCYALTPSNSNIVGLNTYININSSKTFILEHYSEKSIVNFGKGFAVGATGSNEVYADLTIEKL